MEKQTLYLEKGVHIFLFSTPSVCLPFMTYFRPDINTMSADDVILVKLRGLSDLSSFTHVAQARRQGGCDRCVRTPHGPKRSALKEPKTKEKNAKDESFLLICQ